MKILQRLLGLSARDYCKTYRFLRSEMTQIVLSAFKEASQQLEEIDIYDMDK